MRASEGMTAGELKNLLAHGKVSVCRLTQGLVVFALLLLPLVAPADQKPFGQDGIDRNDPNFVTASLMIVEPGGAIFSCAGHAFLRLECPIFKRDFCFSYESEEVSNRLLTYFSGRLKMGLFAMASEKLIADYARQGRGIRQYKLNLPPDAEQRLWRIMDEHMNAGPILPYDYVNRGCALSLLRFIAECLPPYKLEPGPWPSYFTWTRRELLCRRLDDYPWNRLLIQTIVGSELDRDVSNMDKVVLPQDLLAFLQNAKVEGKQLITDAPIEVVPSRVRQAPPFFTPLMVSVAILVTAIVGSVLSWRWLIMPLLVLQFLIGLVVSFLVCCSSLPATAWNWLIIPFNPLPLVFWKWRAIWSRIYAGLLLAWFLVMLVYPHQLVDPAVLVLVGAYVILFWNRGGVAK